MKISYFLIGMVTLALAGSISTLMAKESQLLSATSDALLTVQIKSAFFFHPTTKSPQIHVTTNHSNVYLEGVVDSQNEVEIAKFLSETIPGVNSVNTQQLVAKDHYKNGLQM